MLDKRHSLWYNTAIVKGDILKMMQVVIFSVLQVINVICSTMKYVLTVKARPAVAAIANAASYTIGALITYLLVKQELYIIIPVTFLSNIIGVPIGRLILSCFEKRNYGFITLLLKIQKTISNVWLIF